MKSKSDLSQCSLTLHALIELAYSKIIKLWLGFEMLMGTLDIYILVPMISLIEETH